MFIIQNNESLQSFLSRSRAHAWFQLSELRKTALARAVDIIKCGRRWDYLAILQIIHYASIIEMFQTSSSLNLAWWRRLHSVTIPKVYRKVYQLFKNDGSRFSLYSSIRFFLPTVRSLWFPSCNLPNTQNVSQVFLYAFQQNSKSDSGWSIRIMKTSMRKLSQPLQRVWEEKTCVKIQK